VSESEGGNMDLAFANNRFSHGLQEKVLVHKWYLSERLGRDVGLKVATIDYFENVDPLSQGAHEKTAAEASRSVRFFRELAREYISAKQWPV
jgi:transitional endoplasmic reticulum ATPase